MFSENQFVLKHFDMGSLNLVYLFDYWYSDIIMVYGIVRDEVIKILNAYQMLK